MWNKVNILLKQYYRFVMYACVNKSWRKLNYAVSIYWNGEYRNNFSVAGTFKPKVESVFNNVGLATLLQKFLSARFDVNVVLSESNQDSIRLGISTIGGSCRLRDACRRRWYYNIPSTTTVSMSAKKQEHHTSVLNNNTLAEFTR